MTKIRKVKRKKKYRTNVNRKRLRNKLQKLPTIGCKKIKEEWEIYKSTRSNLKEMGLVYDPNETLQIPNVKQELLKEVKEKLMENSMEIDSEEEEIDVITIPPKINVAQALKEEACGTRRRLFQLPHSQVQFITYLLDKYGEDYEAMARDKKNHYQLTWRQIRAKIKTFKGIPEQYNKYLSKKIEM
ncbi:PREDICTED: nucleolar protein 16 [Polistes canadensis]|uniref:nucleolar protein 16 n=1 Tax=Polistes canadensis TaxID=91411 RepID=UPI000718AC03|nr:PREDICTED: nucleolar protein 16 [Polistes canadensis]